MHIPIVPKKIILFLKIGGLVFVALVVGLYVLASNIDVETYRVTIEEQATQALGRDVSLDGPMALDILTLQPSIRLEDVRIANVKGASNPDMLTIRQVNLEISIVPLLSSELVIKYLNIRDAELSLEIDKKGQNNWTFATASSSSPSGEKSSPDGEATTEATGDSEDSSGSLKAQVHALRFHNVTITYTDARNATQRRVTMDRLRMDIADNAKTAHLVGHGDYQEQDFSMDLTIPSLGVLSSATEDIVLKGNMNFLSSQMNVDVQWQRDVPLVRFDIGVNGNDLHHVARFFRVTLPKGEYGLAITGKSQNDTYSIERLYGRLGKNSVTGNGRIQEGDVPDIVMALQSDVLDMADFILVSPEDGKPLAAKEDKPVADTSSDTSFGTSPSASSPAPSDTSSGASSGKVFSNDPLPLAEMGKINMNVSIQVNRMIAKSGQEIHGIKAALGLRNRRLVVDFNAASLFGGATRAKMTVDGAKTPAPMTLDVDVDQWNFGEALATFAGIDDIRGKGDIDLSVAGKGGSVAQWMASLQGKGDVVLEEGKLDNAIFSFASTSVLDALLPWIGKDKSNILECSVQRFRIVKGVAKVRTFLIRSSNFAVTGTGKVDIGKESVDMLLMPHTDNASLLSVMIPLQVDGPWKDVSIKPDLAATASKALSKVGGVARSLGENLNVFQDGETDGAAQAVPSCADALADHQASSASPEVEKKQRQRKARQKGDDLFHSLEEGLGKLFQ